MFFQHLKGGSYEFAKTVFAVPGGNFAWKKICKTRSSSNISKNTLLLSASGWNPKLHNYHPPLTMIKKCNIASSNPNWFEIIGLCIIRNNHIGGMKMLQFQSNFFIANHFHLLPAKIITLLMTSIIHFDTANNFAWVLTIACQ